MCMSFPQQRFTTRQRRLHVHHPPHQNENSEIVQEATEKSDKKIGFDQHGTESTEISVFQKMHPLCSEIAGFGGPGDPKSTSQSKK